MTAPKLAFACVAASLLIPAEASFGAGNGDESIFAYHDCCGRLAHSEITQVGEITSGSRQFTIYTLWFVNPVSRHGMKHIAVVEGERFVGAYIISSWASPTIAGNRVRFTCENGQPCYGEDLVIENGVLPSRLWVDGETTDLEDTI